VRGAQARKPLMDLSLLESIAGSTCGPRRASFATLHQLDILVAAGIHAGKSAMRDGVSKGACQDRKSHRYS
jgi:hypothetical protein